MSDASASLPLYHYAERDSTLQIASGEVFARIDQKEGVVVFEESRRFENNADLVRAFETKIQEAAAVNQRLQRLDHDIQLSQRYIKKVRFAVLSHSISGMPPYICRMFAIIVDSAA